MLIFDILTPRFLTTNVSWNLQLNGCISKTESKTNFISKASQDNLPIEIGDM